MKKHIKEREQASKRKQVMLNNSGLKKKVSNDADENYGPQVGKPLEIETEELDCLKKNFLEKLTTTVEDRRIIFNSTLDQTKCQEWYNERRRRLTASNFGRICELRMTTNENKVVNEIINPSFQGNKYTDYGIANEPKAIAELALVLGCDIQPSGLVISEDYQYLAASPDELIDGDFLVEIKCPYTAQNVSPQDAMTQKIIEFAEWKNGQMLLNTNHKSKVNCS
ncbi:unnamed protein product [Phaedon cochleariae]|uniref:YqaJ viral recombinase domain-containing protein n=1 Tax=Phaedon cochleariae TaxID=80249 RepID=A0A9N9SJ59_PHACE|nr:unnamed protein product [Phaedon cochleariae]